MNNQQIIDKLSTRLSEKGIIYPKWEINAIIEPFLEIVMETLKNGENVRLTSFGRFTVRVQKQRNFYNVYSGNIEQAAAKRKVIFTPTKGFDELEK